MIRREITLTDGTAGWALISQIEHARISGQLAELCAGRFSDPAIASVRVEVVAAIRHHDDGWAEWEQSPRLHRDERGAPVSFMELEPAEAVAVWSRSIDRAAAHGPLAGWMAAGHFCRLLDLHGKASKQDPRTAQWYDAIQRQRRVWLAAWHALDGEHHTAELAQEALQWLWTFDEASLWFCCRCPAEDERGAVVVQPLTAGEGTPLQMQLRPGSERGQAWATPWRFNQSAIAIQAAAQAVPAAPYADAAALAASSHSRTLQWRFTRNGV
jgi:hypothetical protein